jgi:hypothetical protein
MLAAGLLFVFTTAVIFYQGVRSVEPNAVILVSGSEPFRGAEVTVEGLGQTAYQAIIGEHDKFELPFFVDAGSYTVTVKKDERVMFRGNVAAQRNFMSKLDLAKIVPSMPAPSTRPNSTRP